jgi:hypothetical protein
MAGRLTLGTLGIQDTYISGNPTYSHFLGVFKQHTNFAFDVREHPLIGANFDSDSICFIPLDMGDLITNVTLRYKFFFKASVSSTSFTAVDTPTGNYDDPFTPCAGIHAIEYADLFIGGMHIERLTGDWIYMYHKYHTSDYNFRDSIVPLSTTKEEPYGSDSNNVWNLRQMYVDLPFYFYNNLPASILACKIIKQDCFVRIKFRSLDKLVRPYLNEYITEAKIESASLLNTYAYLDYDELSYLKSRPVDQLITQMQLKRHNIPRTSSDDEEEIKLRFQHPIKTMYFIATKKSRRFSYHDNEELIQYMLNTKFKELGIYLNNTVLFNESFSKLVFENSLKNGVSGVNADVSFDDSPINEASTVIFQLPTRDQIASYSFALYPMDNAPSGHLNFSRIIDQKCKIKLDYSDPYAAEENSSDTESNTTEVQIYAKNYNILHYSSGLCGLKY